MGYFRFNQMDGMYVSEIQSNDPKVINAIDIFNKLALMISGCLAHDALTVSTTESKLKLRKFYIYRRFLKSQTKMPCLQVPGEQRMVKVQVFPSRKVNLPVPRRSLPALLLNQ
jgi:hypothetical protein